MTSRRRRRSRRLFVRIGTGGHRTNADLFFEARVALDLPGCLLGVFAEDVDGVVRAIELAQRAADALLLQQNRDLPTRALVVGTGARSLAHHQRVERTRPHAPLATYARLQIDEGDGSRRGLEH